jgi:hypothetical protein
VIILALILLGIVGLIAMRIAAVAERRRSLTAKYGDALLVERIMQRQVWQGMTADQLMDSRGRPADLDEKVYKTKTVHIYKYNQDGVNRFRTRITVENDEVVGWNER